MNKIIEEIINAVESHELPDCSGVVGAPYAMQLVRAAFEQEGILHEGWEVHEIPMVNRAGGNQIAVAVCLQNLKQQKRFGINFGINGEFAFCDAINPEVNKTVIDPHDTNDMVIFYSIREILEHEFSNDPMDE